MNLLGFLPVAIHPRVLGANPLFRCPGQRNLCLVPHSRHRDCPRALAGTCCGSVSPSLARSWVCTWPSASPTFGLLSSSGSHFSSYRWQH